MFRLIQIFLSLFLESFPISSSGHLELFNYVINKYGHMKDVIFIPSWMEYFVHLPIACCIVFYFLPRWFPLIVHPLRYRSYFNKVILFGIVVELITVCWFVVFQIIGKDWFPMCVGFMITALSLYMSRYFVSKNVNHATLTYRNAIVLGMVQGCALLPGISRFGITFVTALIMGFSSRRAFECSFLIELPLSIAGGLLGLYEMYKYSIVFSRLDIGVTILGMLGMLSGLWIMQRIIDKKSLWLLSWYMVVIACICLII